VVILAGNGLPSGIPTVAQRQPWTHQERRMTLKLTTPLVYLLAWFGAGVFVAAGVLARYSSARAHNMTVVVLLDAWVVGCAFALNQVTRRRSSRWRKF
jgi:hypothetical protein